MSLYVTVPISTEVIELNPDCAFNTACEDGVLVITVDTLRPEGNIEIARRFMTLFSLPPKLI